MSDTPCNKRDWDIGLNYTVEIKIAGGNYNKINWMKFDEKLNPKVESFFESENAGFSTNVRTGTDIELDFSCRFVDSEKALNDLDSIKYNITKDAVFDIRITNTKTNKIIEDSCILTAWSAPNEPTTTKTVDFSIKFCGKPKGLKMLQGIAEINAIDYEIKEAMAQEKANSENIESATETTEPTL